MIKAIIVDDESHASNFLKTLISKVCPDVVIVGVADGVEGAVKLMYETHPDLVFLDIEMPKGSGLKLFDNVYHHQFDVIFTTAHLQYTMQAYRVAALHYLLKPIDEMELIIAVDRCKQKKDNYFLKERLAVLEKNYANVTNHSKLIGIFIDGEYTVLDSDNMVCVDADGSYIYIYMLGIKKPILITTTLGEFQALLPPEDFLRIHRSHLVNKKHVTGFSVKAESVTLCKTMNRTVSAANRAWFFDLFTT